MNDRLAPRSSRSPRPSRSGQAMVEFAIICFVLTAMLAGFLGIIVMGLGSFQNNIATESAGRVLDQHEVFIKENFAMHFNDSDSDDYFDPNSDIFQDITARQVYRFLNEYDINPNDVLNNDVLDDDVLDDDVLYDESRLIISPKDWDKRHTLGLSEINQSLLGSYIFDPDVVPDGETEFGAFRYPGAVVRNAANQQTVLIPLLKNSTSPGAKGIDRTFYVKSGDNIPVSDDWVGPVTVSKNDGNYRIVIFYPSQPGSMLNLEIVRDAEGKIVSQTPMEADDSAITLSDLPTGYTFDIPAINPDFRASTSRGQYGLGETFAFIKTVRPYRAVFETASLFRMGASPITVKYEADGMPITLVDKSIDTHTMDTPTDPFIAYEDKKDQSLNFEQRVVDRFSADLRRYFIDFSLDPLASADNDFAKNVLRLLPNDDGVWRVSVAAEFEAVGGSWGVNHVLQLRLYRNGVRERLIATHNVTSSHAEPISISGQAIIQAQKGDVLQVRVFTDDGGAGTYDVRLTGVPSSNWVAFERVND